MEDKIQDPWRPKALYHYIQDYYIQPDFVVDVSAVWDIKMQAIQAYSSQFYQPGSSEPETAISSKEFLNFLAARAADLGRPAGMKYAEGFTSTRIHGVASLFDLK